MYLTEQKLQKHLEDIFNTKFIHDKQVPNSNIKNRPDYRNEELKLIIEFDGYLHYTNPKTILTDYMKESVYTSLGYKIVRIPYFIQLSTEIIKLLFDEDVNFNQYYPHGFVDDKCTLPAEFCSLGLIRYKQDLKKFECVYDDIRDSLVKKLNILGHSDLVYPVII